MKPITREDIRKVRCPKCKAGPGVQCKKRKDGVSHFARMQAAQMAEGHRVRTVAGARSKHRRRRGPSVEAAIEVIERDPLTEQFTETLRA